MIHKYILDENGEPKIEEDLMKWAQWFGSAQRIIAIDTVDEADVSTVFLALDHSWGSEHPILWESMIFGGALDGTQQRYSSKEEALAGHAELLSWVKQRLNEIPVFLSN